MLTDEIRERRKVEAELVRLAFHDPVTGLRNRVYLSEQITHTLERVHGREAFRAAVLYVDIDNFKAVNDMLGHRMGDMLLIEMADRLRRCCAREHDVLARMGGDEFALLYTGMQGVDQVYRMAQRMLTVMEEPVELAGVSFPMTASIGLCEITDLYTEAEDVLRDADIAMYRAKHE